jgi:hypothetical protein
MISAADGPAQNAAPTAKEIQTTRSARKLGRRVRNRANAKEIAVIAKQKWANARCFHAAGMLVGGPPAAHQL